MRKCRITGICLAALLSFPATPVPGLALEFESETAASVKVHLVDGSVLLFPDGLRMQGHGGKVTLGTDRRSLALPDVLALEFYNERLPRASIRRSADPDGQVSIGPWRSSPSLYSFDGSRFVLEAEAFSSNILAAAEADDLDRLVSGVVSQGRYRLRISNHAWETQYLNELGMLVVDHTDDVEVYSTRKQQLVRVGRTAPINGITSRDGRCVTGLLSAPDGATYRTAPAVTRALTHSITRDWVEFEVQPPAGVRRFFVVVRARNTAFTRVLLEEALLAGRGLEALDLLGGERFRVLEMWRLFRWVRGHLGMRLLVERHGRFESVDRVGGTGPSAWRDVVIKVPVRGDGPVRTRLSFLADTWQIDSIGVSFEGSEQVQAVALPVASLRDATGRELSPGRLRADDKAYLALYPGDFIEATFLVDPPAAGVRRTYFVATRGYFIKWMSPELLAGSERSFAPRDEEVFRAARRWLGQSAPESATEKTGAEH